LDEQNTQLSRSRAAIARLEQALQRLEGVMRPQNGDLFHTDGLHRARQDYACLDEATKTVEARLDDIIDRLQLLLGEGAP
jgi:hypothetical protein